VAGPSEDAYLASLRERVERLQLNRHVEFLGPIREEEKDRLFNESDVLILPSFSENFGLVVVEALAFGVPVIVSTGTPWAKVEEKKCGRFVANDPQSLAVALRELSTCDRAGMGQRGRQWMLEAFSAHRINAALLRCYEQALAEVLP
jgi:glycosyltransferase involved in cell wall biosynthesis